MAITPCNVDTQVISALSDVPVTDDGLTPDQFKAKFDQIGVALKAYINNTLIPQITAQYAAKADMATTSSNGLMSAEDKAKLDTVAAGAAVSSWAGKTGAVNPVIGDLGLTANQVRPIYVTDTEPTAASPDGIYLVTEE